MRKLAFVVILCVCTVGLTAHLIAAPTGRPVIAVMEFHPAHTEKWSEDNEVQIENVDHDHYVYSDDETIDVNVLRQDQDFATELNSDGKDKFIQQIVHGQDVINDLFSVGHTQVLDSHLDRHPNISVLTLHTKQELPDGKYERIEKYFIGVGQTLHAELRWKESAKANAVKQARADFEAGKFGLAGLKEAAK